MACDCAVDDCFGPLHGNDSVQVTRGVKVEGNIDGATAGGQPGLFGHGVDVEYVGFACPQRGTLAGRHGGNFLFTCHGYIFTIKGEWVCDPNSKYCLSVSHTEEEFNSS